MNKNCYIRYGIINIEHVLNAIRNRKRIQGCKTTSSRLRNYAYNGVTCASCGIEAEYFAVESFKKSPETKHLNLYAIDDRGYEIMMTRDHIKPKSKGGPDCPLTNSQTMCCKCNGNKADNWEKSC